MYFWIIRINKKSLTGAQFYIYYINENRTTNNIVMYHQWYMYRIFVNPSLKLFVQKNILLCKKLSSFPNLILCNMFNLAP
jgi:hypothetical protein